MRPGLKRKHWFFAWLMLISAGCALTAQAAPAALPSATPRDTVRSLYVDYAWEAIGAHPFRPYLADLNHQSETELEKYFEPGLARLIRASADCEAKTKGLCGPDVDYIFASPYPAASDMEISPADKSGMVKVNFKQTHSREVIRLDYKMEMTASGWRIQDIHYAKDKSSLRQSLIEGLQRAHYPLPAGGK